MMTILIRAKRGAAPGADRTCDIIEVLIFSFFGSNL